MAIKKPERVVQRGTVQREEIVLHTVYCSLQNWFPNDMTRHGTMVFVTGSEHRGFITWPEDQMIKYNGINRTI